MASGIFLIPDGGMPVRMNEAACDSENLLQGLLEDYPDLLAGDQMESGEAKEWQSRATEVGRADVLR